MKSIITVAAVVVTSLLSFAQEVAAVNNGIAPAKTRVEVRAETLEAIARGEIAYGEASYVAVQPRAVALTRAEVSAKTLIAMGRGEITYGEAARAIVIPTTSVLTRSEVRAETLAAISRGEIAYGEGSPYAHSNRNGNAGNAPAMAAVRAATTLK